MTLLPAEERQPAPTPDVPAALPRWAQLLGPLAELARIVAPTEFVPTGLRGRPAAVAAAILTGDELGMPPMASLNRIHVVDGKIGISAEGQRALALAAGHEILIVESTTTKATVAGRRRGADTWHQISWTMDDARRARLDGRPPWRAYPRQMLLARASAELVRAIFPDALSGVVAVEELDTADLPQLESGSTPALPPPRRRTARRADKAPPGAAPEAAPVAVVDDGPPEPDLPAGPPDDDGPGNPFGPERPTAEPSTAALKAMHAAYRQAGITDRGQRLRHLARTVGRPIGSSRDLTADEVRTVLDNLHAGRQRPPEALEQPFEAEPPTGEDNPL